MAAIMMAIVAVVLAQPTHAGGGGVSPAAMMAIVAVVLVLGLVLGLLLWGMKNPLAWVVLSVLMIAIGLGFAGYGLTTLLALDKPRSSRDVEEAAAFLGGGFGGTAGGVVLLVIALLRRRKRPEGNP